MPVVPLMVNSCSIDQAPHSAGAVPVKEPLSRSALSWVMEGHCQGSGVAAASD
jgi:hypothetical protein